MFWVTWWCQIKKKKGSMRCRESGGQGGKRLKSSVKEAWRTDRREGLWGSAVLGKAQQEQVSEWVSLYALVSLKKEQKSSKVTTCTHGQILKKPYENILVENSE